MEMPLSDDATLEFYARHAAVYAASGDTEPGPQLLNFLAALQPGARILELGSGSGRDAAHMIARGFDVVPTDGSPELAREAERRLGRPVRLLQFEQLDERSAFDGVFASASLLHVPRS